MKSQVGSFLSLCIIIMLLSINSSIAQSYWQRVYGDTCFEEGNSIYLNFDSSFIWTGYTCNKLTGTNDVYLTKVQSNGAPVWQNAIEILGEERGYSVIEDKGAMVANTTFVVTGDTRSSRLGSSTDAFLMQTNASGIPNWINTFSQDKREDHGRCVIKTKDKNYFVAGFSNTCDSIYQDTCVNCHDVFLFKTNLFGTLLWARYIDIAGGDDYGFKVVETNKKYYVTGFTRVTCTNTDIFLMQVDPNGTIDWVRTYGDSLNDYAYSLTVAPDTGLTIVGHTYNYTLNAPDIHVIKTNFNGVPQWKTVYNSLPNTRQNYGRDIAVSKAEGCYFITGYSDIASGTSFDMQLLKVNYNGSLIWQKAYDANYGAQDDKGYSLVTLNTGVAMLGYTFYGAGFSDVYLVRTTNAGVSCEEPIDTNYRYVDTLYQVPPFTVDTEYIYQSVRNRVDSLFTTDTLCYDTSHGHRMALYNLPNNRLAVYPNPTSGSKNLRVEFSSDQENSFNAELFDQFGRKVLTYRNDSYRYEHSYDIPLTNLQSGIYILVVNGYMEKKVVVQD